MGTNVPLFLAKADFLQSMAAEGTLIDMAQKQNQIEAAFTRVNRAGLQRSKPSTRLYVATTGDHVRARRTNICAVGSSGVHGESFLLVVPAARASSTFLAPVRSEKSGPQSRGAEADWKCGVTPQSISISNRPIRRFVRHRWTYICALDDRFDQ
jgi:hypothetical protein